MKVVEFAKEVIRSDGLCRFAYDNVFTKLSYFGILGRLKTMLVDVRQHTKQTILGEKS